MPDLWFVMVITSSAFGYVGYRYAIKAEKNPVLWAALGVGLNVFILGLFLLVGKSRKVRQFVG